MRATNNSTKPKGRKLRSAKPPSNANATPMPPNETTAPADVNTERRASPSMRDARSFAAVVNGTPPSSPAVPLADRALPIPGPAEANTGNEVAQEVDDGEIAKTPVAATTSNQDTTGTDEKEDTGVATDAKDEAISEYTHVEKIPRLPHLSERESKGRRPAGQRRRDPGGARC